MGTQLGLDRLYCCNTCRESFLFLRDKDDHTQQTGHRTFTVHRLTVTECEA